MVLFVNVFRRAVATSAIAATVVLSPVLNAIAQAPTVQITGAGATFPAPLYQRYFANPYFSQNNIQVNYQAVGSGAGIRQVIAGTVDFGGTDAFMTADQISQVDRGVILVPTAGGAVAVVFNLPGVTDLRLSSTVLPDIFAGQITRWNDPRIVADNPGVTLPDLPIRSVVRADSSGTTNIFTSHLSAISSYFRGRIGTGTAPRWTTNPLRANGNPGVAALVKRTRGGIGYVEYAYAKNNDLDAASVQNKNTNEFVAPSLEAAQTALERVEFDSNFKATNITNPQAGYPIVGITWMIVYKSYPASEKRDAVRKMIDWVLTDGQAINPELDYVRIRPQTAADAKQAVDSALGGS
jgi:phosphate transport system substrate-binding protein